MTEKKRRLLHIGITIAILVVGVLGFIIFTKSKPELARQKPPVPVPVVRTMTVEQGNHNMIVVGQGTVTPLRQISLVPQVTGKVIEMSESLVNGGVFKKDDVLIRINPADYEAAVTLAEAKVKDSESKLRLASEESAAAREEWRLLYGKDTNKKIPPLVAKWPQLAAARASLDAARASLEQAALNLERTQIKAPFNGRVASEKVDIGQYVSPGQSLATLYSTDAAEVVLPLADEDLLWFNVPGFTPGDGEGSPAVVQATVAGRPLTWQGRVVRSTGMVDEKTRTIDVVVRVEKPYEQKPPLAAGLFVRVEIEGRSLDSAVVLPRTSLHYGDVVWVVSDGQLVFRKVKVARTESDLVVIESGLDEGEQVVTTPLRTVTDGMKVRTVDSVAAEEDAS
jgi:RND family efflux transporter MFP subunit